MKVGYFFANLLHFARLLRRAGLDVQAGRMLDVVRALEHIDIGSRQDFYHALRCLLVHRPQDLAMFDDVFRVFWRQRSGERTPQRLGALGEEIRFGPPEVELPSLAAEDDSGTTQTNELAALAQVEIRTFSSREVLRETDFARLQIL